MEVERQSKTKGKKGAPSKKAGTKDKKESGPREKTISAKSEQKPTPKPKSFDKKVAAIIKSDEETPIDVRDFMEGEDEDEDEDRLSARSPAERLSSIFSHSPESGDDEEEDQSEEEIQVLNKDHGFLEDFDIFDFAKKAAMQKHDIPKFVVYRNQERLMERIGSLSYGELQKKFGGGTYKIFAYYNLLGSSQEGYIKSQTKLLADVPEETKQEQAHDQNFQPQPQLDVAALVKQMLDMQNQNKQVEVDKLRVTQDGKSTEMTMMMQMMQQNTQLMVQMMQQKSEEADKRMEMLMTLLAANNNKKSDGLGIAEVFEMVTKAKDSGAKEMKLFFQEARDMARELAEEREERVGNSDDKKESTSTTLIKTLAPVIAAMAGGNKPVQTEEAVRRPLQAQALNTPPSANQKLTSPQNPQPEGLNMAKNKVHPALPIHRRKPTLVVPPAQAPTHTESPKAPDTQKPSDGVGKMNIDLGGGDEPEGNAQDEEAPIEDVPLNDGEKYIASSEEPEYIENDSVKYEKTEEPVYVEEIKVSPLQDQVIEAIKMDLMTGIMTGGSHKETVKKAYGSLVKKKISPDQVLKAFPSESSILDVAAKKGVPNGYSVQLKEFYANFSAFLRAAEAAKGKSGQANSAQAGH